LRQLEPFSFPTGLVAGLDFGASPGDIEYIAAALLRLRHEAKGLATEGMVRCEKVKHLRIPRLSSELQITLKKALASKNVFGFFVRAWKRRELTAKAFWLVALNLKKRDQVETLLS
jgi:hypothetical protein